MYLHVICLARRGDGRRCVFPSSRLRPRSSTGRGLSPCISTSWPREGISAEKAHVTASVLVVAILVIDQTAYRLINRFMRKYR